MRGRLIRAWRDFSRARVGARCCVCVCVWRVATGTAGACELCECDGDYELIAREFLVE